MRKRHFEALFETHAQELFGFLVYRTGDRELAQDVLSDTFERVLRSHAQFDRRKASEKTWIYSIALNRVRDLSRRAAAENRAYSRAVAAPLPRADSFEERISDRSELVAALRTLSDHEREALALRFGGDLTNRQIAKLLDEPLPRIEGRVYRGLEKLRAELAPR